MDLKHYYIASNYNISFESGGGLLKKMGNQKKKKEVDVFRKIEGCILSFYCGNLMKRS